MTLQEANEYYLACPDDEFAGVEEVQAAAFAGGESRVCYVGVSGTAGRTAIAAMLAGILQAAGFKVGLYSAGRLPLTRRVRLDGQPAEEAVLSQTERLMALPRLPRPAAELACACACFEAAGCAYAVVELPECSLAPVLPKMPVCAVGHIGPDGLGHSLERLAVLAAGILRKGCCCVTVPNQAKSVLSEIIVAAGKKDCELVVRSEEDIEFLKGAKLASHIDYGGYEVELPFVGRHAACNAAAAVELALALWRKEGVEIPDEAILKGLSEVENRNSILILRRCPLVLLDACHTPEQAEALTTVLRTAKVEHLSAVVALDELDGAEAFFTALETGFLSEEDDTAKNRMAGMADNVFDTLYLVEGGADAESLAKIAKYHFDVEVCDTARQAYEMACAEQNRGVLFCGSELLLEQARTLLQKKPR